MPKFKKILLSGSSVSSVEIGKIAGLDVADSSFWKLGLKQHKHFIEELQKLVK